MWTGGACGGVDIDDGEQLLTSSDADLLPLGHVVVPEPGKGVQEGIGKQVMHKKCYIPSPHLFPPGVFFPTTENEGKSGFLETSNNLI